MDWIQSISRAISYIESNLTNRISVEDVSDAAYSSSSNFQRIFNMITGMTVGDYIRNRRLSEAARDLLEPDSKIIDIAMRYQYDTQESFSKAFTRFHEIPPSKVQRGKVKMFYPLTISVTLQGGFDMSQRLVDEFYWSSIDEEKGGELTAEEKYKSIVSWAGKARGTNPNVFDALTEWILDDSEWTEDKLPQNEQILMQGVFARFKEQNAKLRAYLKELEPAGIVNEAVFKALDRFDEVLSGSSFDDRFCVEQETVDRMFADFSVMTERNVREKIAGGKTGSAGVNTVKLFGYINQLKDCDAGVQWVLFMPDAVKNAQKGFMIDNFEYKKMPAMRFIGRESDDSTESIEGRMELFRVLDAMDEYKSGFDYDVLFMHHYGLGVDVERWHGFWGRFMKTDTPVPDGFVCFDFIAEQGKDVFKPGPPFYSQFAFAVFSGDMEAMHKTEGYDSDAMYDVVRNTMLGQSVQIPYPHKYWTAEVFLNGCGEYSTAYMFSAEL